MILPSSAHPANVLVIGADVEALGWIPRLFRATEFNLLAIVSTHPADLIHHLEDHGYALTTPGPVKVLDGLEQLAALPAPDLILDTTLDPGVLPSLAAAGFGEVPRLNPAAMNVLLGRSASRSGRPASGADLALRLTKEVGRAYRNGRTLGLILIDLKQADGNPPEPRRYEEAQRAVELALRLQDIVSETGDGALAVLLPETGDSTHRVARRLTSNLADLKIGPSGGEGDSPETGPEGAVSGGPRLGWSWFPQEARTAQALLDKARARMGSTPAH